MITRMKMDKLIKAHRTQNAHFEASGIPHISYVYTYIRLWRTSVRPNPTLGISLLLSRLWQTTLKYHLKVNTEAHLQMDSHMSTKLKEDDARGPLLASRLVSLLDTFLELGNLIVSVDSPMTVKASITS
jgi:hypothetical protein